MHLTGIEYFIIANPVLAYAIIFFGMFIEGEGIILLASIFAWQGHLRWALLGAVIIAGTIVGDMAWYGLGKVLRGTRFGIWLDRKYERPGDAIEKMITEHYGRFAVLSKFLYFTTHPTVFLVGWHDYKFKKFLWITTYATIIWAVTVLIVGYIFGYAISLIGFRKIVKRIEIFAVVLFAAVFVAERILKKILARKFTKRTG